MSTNLTVKDNKLWQVAVHEAGHAVASVISARAIFNNDRGFEHIVIATDGKGILSPTGMLTNGYCYVRHWWTPKTWTVPPEVDSNLRQGWCTLMEWEIVRCQAGGAAEIATSGVTAKRAFRETCMFSGPLSDDYRQAFAILDDYKCLTRRSYGIHRFHDVTRIVVLQSLTAIEALAGELCRKGRIAFKQGMKIIEPHLPTLTVA